MSAPDRTVPGAPELHGPLVTATVTVVEVCEDDFGARLAQNAGRVNAAGE